MPVERSWVIATRVTLWVVAVLFAVLLATGIVLSFRYRPDVSFAAHPASPPLFTARRLHRLASTLFLPALGALAISCIGLCVTRHRRAAIALPLLAGIGALATAISGYLLPWDQLSLRAVTVGTDVRGYGSILHGDRVRFVLIRTTEISVADMRRWFWVHTMVFPAVLVALLVALVLAARRSRAAA